MIDFAGPQWLLAELDPPEGSGNIFMLSIKLLR
jgi:hypothetical protein